MMMNISLLFPLLACALCSLCVYVQSKVDGKTATASSSASASAAGSAASAAAATGSSGDKVTTPADKKEKPRSERKRVRLLLAVVSSMLVVASRGIHTQAQGMLIMKRCE